MLNKYLLSRSLNKLPISPILIYSFIPWLSLLLVESKATFRGLISLKCLAFPDLGLTWGLGLVFCHCWPQVAMRGAGLRETIGERGADTTRVPHVLLSHIRASGFMLALGSLYFRLACSKPQGSSLLCCILWILGCGLLTCFSVNPISSMWSVGWHPCLLQMIFFLHYYFSNFMLTVFTLFPLFPFI